jgi:hypothetical protein
MAKMFQIAAQQRVFHEGSGFFHLMQRLHGNPRRQTRGFLLLRQNVPGVMRSAREK